MSRKEPNHKTDPPPPTDKYKYCNHYRELTEDYEIVDFGDGEFVANKAAVPLLKALNEAGLKTRTHHFTGSGDSFISILLDNIEYKERPVYEANADRTKYNGRGELLIEWRKATQ